ncbi:hypothetical protein AOG28_07430 [Cobetia sp. UCD-24C]|nr:hypothetical protein AOG28_07430 [Cobetia sp. UCD-24C]
MNTDRLEADRDSLSMDTFHEVFTACQEYFLSDVAWIQSINPAYEYNVSLFIVISISIEFVHTLQAKLLGSKVQLRSCETVNRKFWCRGI